MKKIFTGLFMAARRHLMTRDAGADEFKTKLDDLVRGKDELTDEGVSSRVEELKTLTGDIPDGEEKSKLIRFLEDFKAVKEQSPEVAKEAAASVATLYESLCEQALKDAPEAGTDKNTNSGTTNENGDGGNAEKMVQETKAPSPEGKPQDADIANGIETAGKAAGSALGTAAKIAASDDDGVNEEYEKIYQYCKKRAEQDAANGTADDDGKDDNAGGNGGKEDGGNADSGGKKDDENGGAVSDHAPHIPVNLHGAAQKGGLSDLFNMAKGGK